MAKVTRCPVAKPETAATSWRRSNAELRSKVVSSRFFAGTILASVAVLGCSLRSDGA